MEEISGADAADELEMLLYAFAALIQRREIVLISEDAQRMYRVLTEVKQVLAGEVIYPYPGANVILG